MTVQKNVTPRQNLSEKNGIELIVINGAEQVTKTTAEHFKRWITFSLHAQDPRSPFSQKHPDTRTVLLPGISFLIDHQLAEAVVDSLNKRFAYRSCIAFISDDEYREDKKQTVSLISSSDKYNTLRLQETTGGSYLFSTDSLITKLKYPFEFVGVGDEWLVLKPTAQPTDWVDYAKEVMKVCPTEETDISGFANSLQKDRGKVSMWWD